MKAFKVEGKFLMKDTWRPFAKEVIGESEADAEERILAIMGGRHKVKRKMITINAITELQLDEITDSTVKYIVEGKNG